MKVKNIQRPVSRPGQGVDIGALLVEECGHHLGVVEAVEVERGQVLTATTCVIREGSSL